MKNCTHVGSPLRKLGRVDWQAQIKFSPAFSLMERQIGFDISDYVDEFILIDATDIAKPRVIRLWNEYAGNSRWQRVGNRIYVTKRKRRREDGKRVSHNLFYTSGEYIVEHRLMDNLSHKSIQFFDKRNLLRTYIYSNIVVILKNCLEFNIFWDIQYFLRYY